MICFEINPMERSIRSVDIPSVPQSYGDNPRYLDDDGDVVYTMQNSKENRGFILEGIRAPLIGRAYVVGTNEDGDDVPPKVTYDWLVEHIDFGDVRDTMFYGARNIRQIQN